MFELPTQLSGIVLEIANITVINLMNPDDDYTDREISNDQCEDPGEFSFSSDFGEDYLDIRQEAPHLEQVRRDKTIQTTRNPLPKKWSRADAVIVRTPLPNLWHLVAALAPPLLKRQKSAINISRKSDIVQPCLVSKAGGDHTVLQPIAGGDHNIPQHQKATSKVAKLFMQSIVFTMTPWPIIFNEKYSMVDEARKLAVEAQNHQQRLASAPVGTPSVSQLTGGPSVIIICQTREALSVSSSFSYSIGLMMIPNPQKFIVKTKY